MWTPVESSNIEALKHEGSTLSVKFKTGATYEYENVPEKKFHDIVGAASVGRTFNELIKSNPIDYPFRRVH